MSKRDCTDTETDWCSGLWTDARLRKTDIFHVYQLCVRVCVCVAAVLLSEWVDLKKLDSNSKTVLKAKYNWQLCALVCFLCTTVCLHEHETRREKRRKHECAACEAIGIWGEGETGRSEKEGRDGAWGPHTADRHYIWGEEEGKEHSSLDQRSEKKHKRFSVFQHIPEL